MSEYECSYCGDSFDNEDELEYLEHLKENHYDDLGRIDKKHIRQHSGIRLSKDPTQKDLIVQTGIILAGLAGTVGLAVFVFVL